MAMLSSEMLEGFGVIDVFAVFWFMVCWVGYSVYSRRVVRRRNCLRGVMAAHRVAWMDSLLKRDNRVGDAALLATLERNVSFFASSTLLILAGLLTALGSGNDILAMVAKLPFHAAVSSYGWEAKLLVLVAVFMYAFF